MKFFFLIQQITELEFQKKNYNLSQKNKLATRALEFVTFFSPLL